MTKQECVVGYSLTLFFRVADVPDPPSIFSTLINGVQVVAADPCRQDRSSQIIGVPPPILEVRSRLGFQVRHRAILLAPPPLSSWRNPSKALLLFQHSPPTPLGDRLFPCCRREAKQQHAEELDLRRWPGVLGHQGQVLHLSPGDRRMECCESTAGGGTMDPWSPVAEW